MKKIILMFILLIISSCKTENSENKKEIINDNNETISEEEIVPEIPKGIADIGHIFKPERMEQAEIENIKGKNDYKYILTNSDLLDKDLENIKIYSEQIVDKYYDFLIRINKPFNYENIIVEIQHRNGKIDVFKYSEIEMEKILNKRK